MSDFQAFLVLAIVAFFVVITFVGFSAIENGWTKVEKFVENCFTIGLLTVAVFLAVVIASWSLGRSSIYNDKRQNRPIPIHEEDPNWDCKTMGNRICGPTVTP